MRPQISSLLSLLSFSAAVLAAPRADILTETSSALSPRDSFLPTIPLGVPCQISANCPTSCCTIWGGVKQCVTPPKFGVSKPVVICIVEPLPPDDPEPASVTSSTSSVSTPPPLSSSSVVSSTTSIADSESSTTVSKRDQLMRPRDADWLPSGQPCQISTNCATGCCAIWGGVKQCVTPPLGASVDRWLCMGQPIPLDSSTTSAATSETSTASDTTSQTSILHPMSLTTLATSTMTPTSSKSLTPRDSSRPGIPLGQPCVISANCPTGCCAVWGGVRQCVSPPSDNIGACLVAPSVPITTGSSKLRRRI